MEKKQNAKSCCICLNEGMHFNKVSTKGEDKITLLTKLKTCVPEIKWLTFYFICEECSTLLNTVYAFRETCFKSELLRKECKEKQDINRDADIKEEIKDENLQDDTNNTFKEEVSDLLHMINGSEDPAEGCLSECEQENVQSSSDSDEDIAISKYIEKQKKFKKTTKTAKKRKKIKFFCEQCSSPFGSSTKLLEHCSKVHDMNPHDVKPFVCDRCPMRFSSSSNLWQHIKYHDGVKSNICSYCGSGFITKTDLVNHEKRHLNKREYKCELCGKRFNTHKHIRSHKLIVHTDSSMWKFVCEVCNKPFPIKSNYDSHMRRHTGDKKFACHLCDKKFTAKCDLQRHIRSHSHVREYQCQLCDKEYKDDRVLKVHMTKVHGVGKAKIPTKERKHICHFCPKAYYAKNKLTRHLYTHSGEKPFNCPICDKKFNDKSYVKQHLRNTHNVDTNDSLENELKISYMNINM